jgi:hypothetical protein
MSDDREKTVIWFNRLCWVLVVECCLGAIIVGSKGEWWLAASFAGFAGGCALGALTEPRQIIRNRRES